MVGQHRSTQRKHRVLPTAAEERLRQHLSSPRPRRGTGTGSGAPIPPTSSPDRPRDTLRGVLQLTAATRVPQQRGLRQHHQAQVILKDCRTEFNHYRPHQSLGGLTEPHGSYAGSGVSDVSRSRNGCISGMSTLGGHARMDQVASPHGPCGQRPHDSPAMTAAHGLKERARRRRRAAARQPLDSLNPRHGQ